MFLCSGVHMAMVVYGMVVYSLNIDMLMSSGVPPTIQ